MARRSFVVSLEKRGTGAGSLLRQFRYPVLSNKCDVNEEAKDRLFDATEADEGRPLDVGWQKQASNQAVRLGFKRPWS
jgi:hypothetical protein